MLTYQVRPRVFKILDGEEARFPADVEVTFHYQPLQPFGKASDGGLTAVQDKPARVLFNANTGQHFVISNAPLAPLEVVMEEPVRRVSLTGNQHTIHQQCDSLDHLRELVESVYFSMPLLLAVDFADPPIVDLVDGRIGDIPFRWELSDWQIEIDITTQERQQQRFATAWNHLVLVAPPERRRLLCALHYFHVACRLRREAKSPGEFLAEALLNLNKILETLYGPDRDDVRMALRQLDFGDDEIERDFIPVMLLRNSVDVGHPSLALFTLRQLETLHRYADRAERTFRTFLHRLLDAIERGHATIQQYEIGPADADVGRTIDTIGARLAELGDRP
ncbi:MAG: hypothetical protein LAP38_06925 [Acidobacteriia bacterium]|nr:hypothetical protein [Terriglobia bacterium]